MRLAVRGLGWVLVVSALLCGCGSEDDENAPVTVSSTPVASGAAAPNNGNSPLNVHFSAEGSSSGGSVLTAYMWDFGDGSGAEGVTADHTYSGDNIYAARVTVANSEGRSDVSDMVSVFVGRARLRLTNRNCPTQKVFVDDNVIGYVSSGQTGTWWVPAGSREVNSWDSRYGSERRTLAFRNGEISEMEVYITSTPGAQRMGSPSAMEGKVSDCSDDPASL